MQRKPRGQISKIEKHEVQTAIELHNEAQALAGKSSAVAFEALQKAKECGILLKQIRDRVGAGNWNIWKEQNLANSPELADKWADKYLKLEQLELSYDSSPRQIRTGLLQLELIPTNRADNEQQIKPTKEKATPIKKITDWALKFGVAIEGYDKENKEEYSTICAGIYNWMKRELYS